MFFLQRDAEGISELFFKGFLIKGSLGIWPVWHVPIRVPASQLTELWKMATNGHYY